MQLRALKEPKSLRDIDEVDAGGPCDCVSSSSSVASAAKKQCTRLMIRVSSTEKR